MSPRTLYTIPLIDNIEVGISPNEQLFLLKQSMKFPNSRILFITIRDPKQLTWAKLGKSNDWIRRYSDNYYIVRGTKGGSHMHILAFINIHNIPVPQKGIHFHIDHIGKSAGEFIMPSREESIDRRIEISKSKYFKNQRYEELTRTVDISKQVIIKQVCFAIKQYWLKVKRKQSMITRHSKKEIEILNILKYMAKNLAEPRENGDEPELYVDYICRLKTH